MLVAIHYAYIRRYAYALIICIISMLFMWHEYSFADESHILVVSANEKTSLDDHLEYLDDFAGVYSIEQVAQKLRNEFKPFTKAKKLGYDYKGKALWIRFMIDSRNDSESEKLLLYDYEHIGNIKVYFDVDGAGFKSIEMDQNSHNEGRQFLTRGYVFKVPISKKEPVFYYVRLEPGDRFLRVSFSWSGAKGLIEGIQISEFLNGLFFGALLIMWFYNASLLVFLRDRSYLYYIYYLGCFIAVFAQIYGFVGLFVKLNLFREQLFALAGYGAIHGLVLFTRQFLSLKKTLRWIDRYLMFFQWMLVVGGLAVFLQPIGLPYRILNFFILLVVPAAVIAGFMRLKQGYAPARIYSLGWVVFSIALAILAARSLNLLPINAVTDYAVRIASVWEAALFSIALSYRIKLADAEVVEQQEKALQAERKAVEIAKSTTAEKSKFLSMIGHELRSPLQGIISGLDVLESRALVGIHNIEFVRRIRGASTALSMQLRDILTFAQGELGKLEIQPEPFEATELVQDAIDLHKERASKKGLNLSMKAPKEPVYVVADPTRIAQILNNLIGNAVKYTQSGIVMVELYPYQFEKGELRIDIRDTGPGIAEQLIPTLFTAQHRYAELDPYRESSGIGLAIVQVVLQHLGGCIEVNSQQGAGACFSVHIPAASAIEEVDSSIATHHGCHILLVDDRDDVLDGLESVITELGYTCDKAISAVVASNFLASKKYDLALIDLEMPFKNGRALASEIRRSSSQNREIRLMAISASSPITEESTSPFDGYLQKPIHKTRLEKLIQSVKKDGAR
jgi:two-component system, sensor histidine kinase LadS